MEWHKAFDFPTAECPFFPDINGKFHPELLAFLTP